MGNLARKIIEAIQHSMLGSLLVRLVWPCCWLVWLVFDNLSPDGVDYGLMGPCLVLLLSSVFLIWLLGTFANRRPRSALPLERVQDDSANGFEAWYELPAGGLRPPPLIRWIVTTIGHPPQLPGSWIGFGTAMSSMTLAFALAVLDSNFWTGIYPPMGDPSDRLVPALAFVAVFTGTVIRNWASDQRKNLEPQLVNAHQARA